MPTPEFFLTPNGIDASTGGPVTPGITPSELFDAILNEDSREKKDPAAKERLAFETNLIDARNEEKLGLLPHLDVDSLSQAGWGFIYPKGTPQAVLDNLQDLLAHRKGAAGKIGEYELAPGESAISFRNTHGETAGLVDPDKLPYYLMIVGPPEGNRDFPAGISFDFQHSLATVHAVGRLHFDDLQGFKDYADKVIAYETGQTAPRHAEATFFSPTSDNNTKQSSIYLANPLREALEKFQVTYPLQRPGGGQLSYKFTHFNGEDAKKQAMTGLLASPPSLLFTATHGLSLSYDPNDSEGSFALQQRKMGALVCAEWEGFVETKVDDAACFFATDLPAADLTGLVMFSFACYSAGAPKIPRFTDHPKAALAKPGRMDFISALPQATLRKGALAFIGHIDQTWGYSYVWIDATNTKNFESALGVILKCRRVGFAMEAFSQAYLDLNDQLTGLKGLINSYKGGADNGDAILRTWMARQDAKSYIIIGDPAARLELGQLIST